jgi:hypothetical protein
VSRLYCHGLPETTGQAFHKNRELERHMSKGLMSESNNKHRAKADLSAHSFIKFRNFLILLLARLSATELPVIRYGNNKVTLNV